MEISWWRCPRSTHTPSRGKTAQPTNSAQLHPDMYINFSFGRCAAFFLLLVVLAFFISCTSGFRIDSMESIVDTHNGSPSFSSAVPIHFRTRHHHRSRKLRHTPHTEPPHGRIDTLVIPPTPESYKIRHYQNEQPISSNPAIRDYPISPVRTRQEVSTPAFPWRSRFPSYFSTPNSYNPPINYRLPSSEHLRIPPPIPISYSQRNILFPIRRSSTTLSRASTLFDLTYNNSSTFPRLQRSSDKSKQLNLKQDQSRRRRRRGSHCQRQDVARKAYLANTVVRAKAESMSSNRVHNYSVTFRILERYKTPFPIIDDTLRLTFASESRDMNCEGEGRLRSTPTPASPKDQSLVRANILQKREYFLFLDTDGMHNYTVVGMPVLKRKRKRNQGRNKDLEDIRRVTNRNFGK